MYSKRHMLALFKFQYILYWHYFLFFNSLTVFSCTIIEITEQVFKNVSNILRFKFYYAILFFFKYIFMLYIVYLIHNKSNLFM